MSARDDWKSLHQQHAAKRTRAIRDRALFSDVEVHVKGVVFHCHRYVLAQSSDLFLSEFACSGSTELSKAVGEGGKPQPFSNGKLEQVPGEVAEVVKAEDRETSGVCHTDTEADVCKRRQEILLEDLGTPAEKSPENLRSVAGDLGTSASTKSCNRTEPVTPEQHDSDTSNNNSSSSHLPPFSAAGVFSGPGNSAPFPREAALCGQGVIVELDFLSADDFSAVLDAVYNGEDPVTNASAVRLYKAAVRLRVSSLVEHSERVISDLLRTRQIDAAKALDDPDMAKNSGIEQAALSVLLTDFGPDTGKAKWFLSLSAEKLFSALSDQRLNVRHEDEVYRALVSWYEHDPWCRERHMAKALSRIRLANLSRRTLVEEVLLHPLCSSGGGKAGGLGSRDQGGGDGSDVGLLDHVQRALTYHLLPDRRHDEALPCADFRPSQASERVLLVLGDQSDRLYAFSFARKAWFKLAPPPEALGLGVAACTHGDDLYVSGGDQAMARFWRYRAGNNTWKRLRDLNVGRRSHCCVSVGDCVYVLGGKDDKMSMKKDTLDSVEVFHLQDKGQGWSTVNGASLPVPVRSMAAAVVEDKIYVLGGRTNGFQKTVSVIQCFDTRTQQSSVVGYLPSPSCLGRPFVVNKVTYILETSGDIVRFRPRHLPNAVDPKSEIWIDLLQTASPENGVSFVQRQIPSAPQSLEPSSVEQHLLDSDEKRGYSTVAEEAVVKVGHVRTLHWKWYGVARSHQGALYVVAGELPENASAPQLSLSTDDQTAFGEVRFIRPEKLSMCYVNAHMCIPKSFLVEKVA